MNSTKMIKKTTAQRVNGPKQPYIATSPPSGFLVTYDAYGGLEETDKYLPRTIFGRSVLQ